MKTRVLISAAGTLASVSYIRHLQLNGYYVIGINLLEDTVGKIVCDEYYSVPPVSAENYIDFIDSNIKFDIYIPWLDEEHILYANTMAPFHNKILTSDKKSVLVATDKIETYNFCIQNNIDIAVLTNKVPAFVRKKFSRGSKNAYKETDQHKLDRLDKNEYLVQELAEGIEYTVDVLCSTSGEFLFGVPRKRNFAQNVSIISEIDMNRDIIAFCERVVKYLPFKGAINIQLFYNKDTIKLVEINPRLAGTAILSIYAGFDLFVDSIRLLQGEDIDINYSVSDGLKMYRYYDELYI